MISRRKKFIKKPYFSVTVVGRNWLGYRVSFSANNCLVLLWTKKPAKHGNFSKRGWVFYGTFY